MICKLTIHIFVNLKLGILFVNELWLICRARGKWFISAMRFTYNIFDFSKHIRIVILLSKMVHLLSW